MIEIKTVEHTREIPSNSQGYRLIQGFTEDDALELFQERYRFTPRVGYRFANMLYFEKEEK